MQELQSRYAFTYYSTFEDAISYVNDGTPSANATKDNAEAGIYEDNGNKYVVLLKDTEVESTVYIYKDMTLNLGGHKLSSSKNIIEAGYTTGNATNFNIDARLVNSKIVLENKQEGKTERTTAVMINDKCNAVITGGTYIINADTTDKAISIDVAESLKITNATLNSNNDIAVSRGMNVVPTGNATMLNCYIETEAKTVSLSVYTSGIITISNCKLL